MSSQSDVIVKLDDRIRLVSAVLSATNYPDKAQKLKPHGTHMHARATRKYLQTFNNHPAVLATQSLLDAGTPLEALFALVSLMNWPDLKMKGLPAWVPAHYDQHLRDFYEKTQLAQLWERDGDSWQKAIDQTQAVFQKMKLRQFFADFLDDVPETFTFIPNISYPTDYDIGFKLGDQLFAIIPPPLAWGDSPPWPYNEATMITQSYRSALTIFGRELVKAYLRRNIDKLSDVVINDLPVNDQFKAQHPTWEDQFTALFLSAIVGIYLEDYVDEKEYKSYMLMEKKLRGMAVLPGTISVLRRFLQEKGTNDKYSTLIEFLPIFPRQLRVAQKIISF